ncbi:MFS transporter [Paraburkholderia bannensis]|uniref:MFS transporter n=1 Tax=Paraburkholderia bannensis TaxID=765414 RepID=UPI002AB31DBB|nr:MFS transporter [Paraburkholderia bannensis]
MKYLMSNRRFAFTLLGNFLSQFGAWINYLAILNLALYEFHASPITLVMVSGASLLPPVVARKFIAKITSLHPADRVLPVSLLCLIATTFGLLFCHTLIEFLLVLSAKSLIMGLSDPAINAFVADSIEEGQRQKAFSMLNLSRNISKIVAPSLGAVTSLWLGDRHVVLVSAIFLLAAAPCFLLSKRAKREVKFSAIKIDHSGKSNDIPIADIFPLLVYVSVYALLVFSVNNQFPLILKNQSFGKSALGLLVSASAFGGVVGNLNFLKRHRKTDIDNNTLLGMLKLGLTSSIIFIYIGLAFHFKPFVSEPLLFLGFASTGFVGSRFAIARNSYITSRYESNVANATARVQSAQLFCQFSAPLLGATLVNKLTTSMLFCGIGLCAALAYLVAAFLANDLRIARRNLKNL